MNKRSFTVNLTPDNNHFEAIRDLEKWGLVVKLPQSTLELQVFAIDTVLKKKDFYDELRRVFGGAFDALSADAKEVLQSVYHHNKYGALVDVSASLIGNHLFFQKHSHNADIKEYGNYKRKVRTTINNLEKGGFIIRKHTDKPDYDINLNFTRTPSIFDTIIDQRLTIDMKR
jgi:ATP-dependent DNA helicase RecG